MTLYQTPEGSGASMFLVVGHYTETKLRLALSRTFEPRSVKIPEGLKVEIQGPDRNQTMCAPGPRLLEIGFRLDSLIVSLTCYAPPSKSRTCQWAPYSLHRSRTSR